MNHSSMDNVGLSKSRSLAYCQHFRTDTELHRAKHLSHKQFELHVRHINRRPRRSRSPPSLVQLLVLRQPVVVLRQE